ncbi:uncharacterized protein LOC116015893 [Ipomoea triloba]|uniref:uncharacterized protein LOC116015893 n=1 Tax=Ipomoea triloba TaxID=35885 RepID=UPI00125DFF7C|nr:uncharacterized protein LOC116015893 [Ipomoea triloba]
MMHKHCFEALDRTMRDVLHFVNEDSANRTFGGKILVFGGDFRTILPVVPKGSRQDIVSAVINSSYLWSHCDGTIGEDNDGYAEVDIPYEMLLKSNCDLIATIVQSTFPNFTGGVIDGSCFHSSAVLAPTLEVVNEVNQYLFDLTIGEGKRYYSSNTACKAYGSNTVGSPVMLMRNIDHTLGLCNGTRLVVTRLTEHVVEGNILTRPNARTKVLIARMTIMPSDTRLPFKFNRRQFTLMLSYAMTINKSQAQTLSNVGLILRK